MNVLYVKYVILSKASQQFCHNGQWVMSSFALLRISALQLVQAAGQRFFTLFRMTLSGAIVTFPLVGLLSNAILLAGWLFAP